MKYTIITPIYNAEDYIQRCVDNVARVFSDNYEHILINDGSTDNTELIVKKILSLKSENLFLISNPGNKGVSYSRNIGLEHAKGDYIVFLDVDDTLSDNFVESIERVFITNPKVEVVRFNHNQSPVRIKNIEVNYFNEIPTEVILSYYLHSSSTQLINANLAKLFKFDESIMFGEDMLYSYYLLNNSKNTYLMDEILYEYHFVQDSASNSLDFNTISNRIKSINAVYDTIIVKNNEFKDLYKLKKNREVSMQIMKLYLLESSTVIHQLDKYSVMIEKNTKIVDRVNKYDVFWILVKNNGIVSRMLTRLYLELYKLLYRIRG